MVEPGNSHVGVLIGGADGVAGATRLKNRILGRQRERCETFLDTGANLKLALMVYL